MDPKTKLFFLKKNAYKKANKVRLDGATAWVLPKPGFFCRMWLCSWYV